MKQLFFDLETTGVCSTIHAPIQIAAIICEEFGPVTDSFNEKIKTQQKIDPQASAVHGIYARDLVNCRSEAEVLRSFLLWTKDHQIDCVVGHNITAFDLIMLKARCKLFNLAFPFENVEVYDTRKLVSEAKKKDLYNLKQLGRKWSLSLTAKTLRITHDQAHDALGDVITTKKIYDKLRKEV